VEAAHIWLDGPYYPTELRGARRPLPLPAVHLGHLMVHGKTYIRAPAGIPWRSANVDQHSKPQHRIDPWPCDRLI
jgi:hypothetical protein